MRTQIALKGLTYEEMSDEQIQLQIANLNEHRANALRIYQEAREMRDKILSFYEKEMLAITESRKVASPKVPRTNSNHLGMD